MVTLTTAAAIIGGASSVTVLGTQGVIFGVTSLRVLVELHVPVSAAAEGLVAALTTPTQREVVGRPALQKVGTFEFRTASDHIWALGDESDDRFATAVSILRARDRIAQCSRRTLLDRLCNLVGRRALGVDERFLLKPEDFRLAVRAAPSMGA